MFCATQYIGNTNSPNSTDQRIARTTSLEHKYLINLAHTYIARSEAHRIERERKRETPATRHMDSAAC